MKANRRLPGVGKSTQALALVLCFGLTALRCGGPGAPSAESSPATDQSEARTVFARSQITLTRLGVSVLVPLTVGSRWAADDVTIEPRDVVAVGPSGLLTPLRNGEAVLHSSISQSRLLVHVRAPVGVVVGPAAPVLLVQDSTHPIELLDDEGELPKASIEWQTADPSIAYVENGVIHAGSATGNVSIDGAYGATRTTVLVTVARPGHPGPLLKISTANPTMQIGVAQQLAVSGGSSQQIAWSSGDERVIRSLRNGVIYAASSGRSKVCATLNERSSCVEIQVIP